MTHECHLTIWMSVLFSNRHEGNLWAAQKLFEWLFGSWCQEGMGSVHLFECVFCLVMDVKENVFTNFDICRDFAVLKAFICIRKRMNDNGFSFFYINDKF